jgi:hypothetical protein
MVSGAFGRVAVKGGGGSEAGWRLEGNMWMWKTKGSALGLTDANEGHNEKPARVSVEVYLSILEQTQ